MQTHKQLPSVEEAALARLCSQELAEILETKAEIQTISVQDKSGEGHSVNMPVSALRILVDVLTELGEGNTVKLMPIHAELTTQKAADLLNVSRPTLIKLLDDGEIPFHHSGNRRKVRFADLSQYQETLEKNRLNTLDELNALDQKSELGY